MQKANRALGLSGQTAEQLLGRTGAENDARLTPLWAATKVTLTLKDQIALWSASTETFKAFVTEYVAKPGFMLGYLPSVSGSSARRTSTLDALAQLTGQSLVIYTQGPDGVLSPIHQHKVSDAAPTVRLYHTSYGPSGQLNHFDRLETEASLKEARAIVCEAIPEKREESGFTVNLPLSTMAGIVDTVKEFGDLQESELLPKVKNTKQHFLRRDRLYCTFPHSA